MFELYCKLVNYFGPSVGFELSVVCYPADMEEYRKVLAIPAQGDQFDVIRKEYSDMLVRQVSKSRYDRRICCLLYCQESSYALSAFMICLLHFIQLSYWRIAISLWIGCPCPENFSSDSVITFPLLSVGSL